MLNANSISKVSDIKEIDRLFLGRRIFSILHFILQSKSNYGYTFTNKIFVQIYYLLDLLISSSPLLLLYVCTWGVCRVHSISVAVRRLPWGNNRHLLPLYNSRVSNPSCQARSTNMLPIKHSLCLLHSNIVVGNSLNRWEPVWLIISITHEDISHEPIFSQIKAIKYARRLYSSTWKRLCASA